MLIIELLRRFRDALRRALARRRSRLDLLTLDDHMLKDIGISRADAIREGDKPFWRL
ncbi:hypothetical protein GCM10011348_18430 [Marinobacterium nitratireducens]|uniref:YjiS-like domain-containing protein n=1 Tax=Marinobacterium nitratireducens TaxID=518897 RepID=A0A918DSR4_9GAMM|nr:DUF1127 domain-containing protein [Marinobacterium nitratireducens]GGO80835.1 hypothetical protein GCM10011348_18430 [Marinobacterium nitratireducens]